MSKSQPKAETCAHHYGNLPQLAPAGASLVNQPLGQPLGPHPIFRANWFRVSKQNFAKFGLVAALSRVGLSFGNFSRFVGWLSAKNETKFG